jgi:hypothetical protein
MNPIATSKKVARSNGKMLAASGFYNGKNMGKTMLMMVGKPKIS